MRWLTSKLEVGRQATATELGLAFALGTFETCMFVYVFVFTLHLSGDLAGQIEDLNTLIGIGLFLLLWTTTCYCTLCAWMQIGVSRLRFDSPSLGRMLLYGAKWGALDGYAFALALAGTFLVGIGAIYLVEVGPVSLISIAVLGTIGMAFGALVGMVLGATFGMIAALVVIPLIRLAPVLLDEQGHHSINVRQAD